MSGGRVSATGRYRRIIRTVRTTSKREAKLALAELETAVAAGRVSFEDQTVAELLHKWMEHIEGLRRANSTLYHYRQYINRDINRRLGKIRLSRLTVLDIDRVYAGMRRRDLAPATIRQVHAILRASLNQPRSGIRPTPRGQARLCTVATAARATPSIARRGSDADGRVGCGEPAVRSVHQGDGRDRRTACGGLRVALVGCRLRDQSTRRLTQLPRDPEHPR
ncbi:MAG: hypothetical protein JWM12_3013 [Ilumatobacteraceae bacterium]|nr:hypothetical protein [Ilumatobacteraceae bacterium]